MLYYLFQYLEKFDFPGALTLKKVNLEELIKCH